MVYTLYSSVHCIVHVYMTDRFNCDILYILCRWHTYKSVIILTHPPPATHHLPAQFLHYMYIRYQQVKKVQPGLDRQQVITWPVYIYSICLVYRYCSRYMRSTYNITIHTIYVECVYTVQIQKTNSTYTYNAVRCGMYSNIQYYFILLLTSIYYFSGIWHQ